MLPIEQTPYWKTLQPVIKSGAMQDAMDGRIQSFDDKIHISKYRL